MAAPPRPTPEQLARYAEGFNKSASMRFFGVSIDFPEGRKVRATLPIRTEHRGGLGTDAVNGAILSAIFDLLIGCTGALVDPARRSATMQLSMSFERPLAGELLVGEAWIDRAGGSTIFASAELRDDKGEVCARCQGVVKLAKIGWAGGDSPAVN